MSCLQTEVTLPSSCSVAPCLPNATRRDPDSRVKFSSPAHRQSTSAAAAAKVEFMTRGVLLPSCCYRPQYGRASTIMADRHERAVEHPLSQPDQFSPLPARVESSIPLRSQKDVGICVAHHRMVPQSPSRLPPTLLSSPVLPAFLPNTFQNLNVSSPAPVTIVVPSGLQLR
jgi:hypothetical protein